MVGRVAEQPRWQAPPQLGLAEGPNQLGFSPVPLRAGRDLAGEGLRVLDANTENWFRECRTRRFVLKTSEWQQADHGCESSDLGVRPWKEELFRIAERLHTKTEQRRWTDRTDANLEKHAFVGCYAIRKLIEASDLSKSVLSAAVPCTVASTRPGRRVTYRNWHRLDELYDFEGQSETSLSLKDLCDQFIHS